MAKEITMDKQQEESRKSFEGWVKNQYSCEGNALLRVGPNKERYHQVEIQECWESWQASRASIVVELPPINIPSGSDTLLKAAVQMAVEVQTNKCADSLRSIGLSIKG